MGQLTMEFRNDSERLALEQAIAFVSQVRQVALDSAAGTVLAACEKVALNQGRALLRSTLAAAVAERIAAAEKKGAPPAAAPMRTPDATRERTTGRC